MSCAIGQALDTMNVEDRQDMQAVLGNHVSSVIISRWFERRGFSKCSTAMVTKHRDARCDCYEEEE